MSEKEIKDYYAVLMVQDSELWHFGHKINWPKNVKEKYKIFNKKLQNFEKENFSPLISMNGYCDNDDIGHYEIDEAIEKKFSIEVKNGEIQTDSEGGGFYCYFLKKHSNKLSKFLNKKYPDLNYEIDEESNGTLKPFRNWSSAEKYVKENNIKVDKLINNSLFDKINEFDEKLKNIKKEKQNFINSIKI